MLGHIHGFFGGTNTQDIDTKIFLELNRVVVLSCRCLVCGEEEKYKNNNKNNMKSNSKKENETLNIYLYTTRHTAECIKRE